MYYSPDRGFPDDDGTSAFKNYVDSMDPEEAKQRVQPFIWLAALFGALWAIFWLAIW